MGIITPGGNNGDFGRKAAKEAAIIHFIEATTIQIYANLVSGLEFAEPDDFRRAAQSAKSAAPFLAAELGMVNIQVQEEENEDE